MPDQPKTPLRAIRIEDELWERAKAAAHNRGETVTDAIRRALREYVTEGALAE